MSLNYLGTLAKPSNCVRYLCTESVEHTSKVPTRQGKSFDLPLEVERQSERTQCALLLYVCRFLSPIHSFALRLQPSSVVKKCLYLPFSTSNSKLSSVSASPFLTTMPPNTGLLRALLVCWGGGMTGVLLLLAAPVFGRNPHPSIPERKK